MTYMEHYSLKAARAEELSAQLDDLLPALAPGTSARHLPQRVVLTSVDDIQGAQLLAASFARNCAERGYKTLAVDANLQKPSLHEAFRTSNERGLSTLLASRDAPHRLSQPTEISNLMIIPAGPQVANSSGLLSSEDIFHRLDPLARRFDYMVVDATSLPASLAATVSASAEMVVVIAERHRTRLRRLSSLLDALRARGTVQPVILMVDTAREAGAR